MSRMWWRVFLFRLLVDFVRGWLDVESCVVVHLDVVHWEEAVRLDAVHWEEAVHLDAAH